MRSIFFDVDGVLIHGFHSRPEMRLRWDVDLQRDLGVDPNHLSTEFFPGPFLREVLPGRRSLVDVLGEWLSTQGYSVPVMRLIEYWLTKDSVLNQGLIELVTRLRAAGGCHLYVATNQEHLRAMDLWSRLGFSRLFDDIFYAARLGVVKPNPEFFAAIERTIGPQREPPLLFDDSANVIDGARAHGWEAVLYDELADCADHPAIAQILAQAD